jgi:DNA-binding Lrp family transcriptional regulator
LIERNVQLTRPLDAIDRNIVALLQESAKRTFADIGSVVGLSATAVKRRVDRLERDGVILGYGARVNWRALGEAIESLIEIYCADRTSPADVGRSLSTVAEIISAFTVSGEADAVIRVRVDSIDHLRRGHGAPPGRVDDPLLEAAAARPRAVDLRRPASASRRASRSPAGGPA